MKMRTILGLGIAAAAAVSVYKNGLPADVQKFISFHPLPPVPNKKLPLIACVGDSITYGAGVEAVRKQRSYPALLEGLFRGEYQVLNYGLNGRTLLAGGNRPYGKELFYSLARDSGAQCFILMLGTNDTKPMNWDEDRYEPELEQFIRSFQELRNRPQVFVMKPPCCFSVDGTGEVAYEIRNELIRDQVIPAVERAAKKSGAGLIDLYTLTERHPEYYDDGVHPNFWGNQVIAQYIYDQFTKGEQKLA